MLVLAGVLHLNALAGAPPFVATQRAAWLEPTSLKLQGMAVPNGQETIAWFEWGNNSTYGNITATQSVGSGSAVVHLSQSITGLLPQTPYWYRLVASNQLGVVYGKPQLAAAGKMLTGWGQNDYGATNIPAGLSNIVMSAGGSGHGMALRNDGTVVAWGANFDRQTNVPAGLNDAAAISSGYRYSVALRRNGSLVAWGEGTSGQTNTPAQSNLVAVSAAANYGLALTTHGTVLGWGLTFYGETNFPPGLSNVVEVSAGGTHGLALRADGTVAAWGLNDYGQATVPPGLSNIVSVSAGGGFSAVLRRDGTVYAWGLNGSGQTSIPAGLSNVLTISCGGAHTLALKNDGTFAVWGHNYYGQTNTPANLAEVVDATAGYYFSLATTLNRAPFAYPGKVAGLANQDLALTLPAMDPDRDALACRITALPASGALYQWTSSGRGALISAPNTPVSDPGGRVIYVPPTDALGSGYAALQYTVSDGFLGAGPAAVTIDLLVPRPYVMTHPANWLGPTSVMLNGMVVANGAASRAWFEWGTNTAYGDKTESVDIGEGTGVVPVNLPANGLAPQRAYWCRLVASNRWGIACGPSRIVCAGRQAWVLGNGSFYLLPSMPGLSNIVSVAAGCNHTLAVRKDGTVAAWGDDAYGQIGMAATLSGVTAVAAGCYFSAALKNDGTVVAWGNGSLQETNVPAGLNNVALITSSLAHTLALRRDGTVVAWGYNSQGQTNVPAGLSNVVGIAAGNYHSIALKADGTIVGWGSNLSREAVQPNGLAPVTQVAAGANFSAALHPDGTVTAWGDNTSFQTNLPPALTNVVYLSAASMHGYALKANLALETWGYGAEQFPGGWSNVVNVAAGSYRDIFVTINRGPTAFEQYTSGPINLDVAIQFSGSDPEGDSLGYKIDTLPSRGTLYQYNNGVRGPAITSPGVAVTDGAGRVFYAPEPGTYGDDYSRFTFRSNDGEQDSAPATVAVRITVPKPFVATQSAVWQDNTTAVLRGAVMPNNLPTRAWFEWGLDGSVGARVGETNLPVSPQQFHLTQPIPGLSAQVAYWYRLVASNYWGINYGAWSRFCAAKSVVPWGGSWSQTNGLSAISNVVFSAAGNDQVLLVKPDGALVVMGNHNAVSAAPPAPLSNIVSAAGGAWHSLALGRDGKVTAWGYNEYGSINVPPGLSNVVAVAAGNFHNLALKQDGSVVGWGAYGGTVPLDLTNAVAVACGFNHSMALTCDGRVFAWGSNDEGETNVPPRLEDVVAIAARGDHCMALRSNGTVVVWGRGDFGQTNIPSGLSNVVSIGSGGYQAMALTDSSRLVVWGMELSGQTNVLPALTNVVAVSGGVTVGLASALNRGPTALPGGGTVWANQDLPLTLAGTDPERDVLTFRIRTLPAAGTLYQCADGARGDAILVPDTMVSDPGARLIFAPALDSFGSNYASFTFSVNDGQYESVPVSVNVNVLAGAPQAGTMRSTASSATNMQLHGMALPNGLTTFAWFEWGTDTTYGNTTPAVNAGVLPRTKHVAAVLEGLQPYQTYWCRLVASNALGVSYGQPQMMCAAKRLFAWGANSQGQTGVPFVDKVVDVSGGGYHGLAAMSDGTPLAWGYNGNGEITIPSNVSNVVGVAAGTYHSVALQNNGIVRAWGYGGYQRTSVPTDLTNAVAVAAGNYNTLALKDDGVVVSWGATSYSSPITLLPHSNLVAVAAGSYHSFGLSCDGRVIPLWDGGWPLTPTNVTEVAAIAAGDNHGLGLRKDGTVVAWGDNGAGQTNIPPGLTDVIAVSANGNHSLALLRNGHAVAWGSNGAGEGTVPTGLTNATQIAAGYQFNLAAVLNRQPTASGKTIVGVPNQDLVITLNASDPDSDLLSYSITTLPTAGQLYQYRSGGRGEPITAPGTVLSNAGWVVFAPALNEFGAPHTTFSFIVNDGQVNSGEAQIRIDINGRPFAATRRADPVSTTSVKLNGSALAQGLPSSAWFEWGPDSAYGERTPQVDLLPSNTMQQVSAPLTGLASPGAYYCRFVVSNAAGVSFGGPQLFTTGGKATVWGSYYIGQIFQPTGLGYVTAIAAGATHTVALRQDGTVAAWGFGDYSTGTGKTNVPAGLSDVVAISAGAYHSAALKRDGRVTVWGYAMYGFNGLTNLASGLSNTVAISLGSTHLLALRSNGTVTALGPSASVATNVPYGLSNVVAVAAGDYHSLALRCDGTVVGWGNTPQATVPSWLSNVTAIAAGASHSMALRADGTVVAWGNSVYGKTNVPASLSNVVAIAAGVNHSLALKANGNVVGWGSSNFGITNQPLGLSNVVAIASGGNQNAALAPNRPPFAVSPQDILSTAANHDRAITLIARDADLDALTTTITALPAKGALFQYAGATRGTPISSPGTAVQDAGNRVIFAPAINDFGTPYGQFEFVVSDGELVSAPGTVRVGVDPLVTPVFTGYSITNGTSFQFSFTGDANTAYCVWGSTDLVSWQYLGSGTATAPGQFVFLDASASPPPRRFYRISTRCN